MSRNTAGIYVTGVGRYHGDEMAIEGLYLRGVQKALHALT
jgi:hypothetical protein